MPGGSPRTGSSGKAPAQPPRPAVGADLIIPALAGGLTVYYIVSTAPLTWEARSTGWLVGFVLLGLCALQAAKLVGQRLRGQVTLGLGELAADTLDNRKRLGLLIVLWLFVVALPVTGMTLGLLLVIAASMMIMGVRRPAHVIGIATATAIVVFLLFMLLLKSRLPRGALDDFLVALLTGQGG